MKIFYKANYGPLGEYLFKGAVKTIPAGRLGNTNDDLAPSVLFMLSDGAKYTTGKGGNNPVSTINSII